MDSAGCCHCLSRFKFAKHFLLAKNEKYLGPPHCQTGVVRPVGFQQLRNQSKCSILVDVPLRNTNNKYHLKDHTLNY